MGPATWVDPGLPRPSGPCHGLVVPCRGEHGAAAVPNHPKPRNQVMGSGTWVDSGLPRSQTTPSHGLRCMGSGTWVDPGLPRSQNTPSHGLRCMSPATLVDPGLPRPSGPRHGRVVPCRGEHGGQGPRHIATDLGRSTHAPAAELHARVPRLCGFRLTDLATSMRRAGVVRDRGRPGSTQVPEPMRLSSWPGAVWDRCRPGSTQVPGSVHPSPWLGCLGPLQARIHPSGGTHAPKSVAGWSGTAAGQGWFGARIHPSPGTHAPMIHHGGGTGAPSPWTMAVGPRHARIYRPGMPGSTIAAGPVPRAPWTEAVRPRHAGIYRRDPALQPASGGRGPLSFWRRRKGLKGPWSTPFRVRPGRGPRARVVQRRGGATPFFQVPLSGDLFMGSPRKRQGADHGPGSPGPETTAGGLSGNQMKFRGFRFSSLRLAKLDHDTTNIGCHRQPPRVRPGRGTCGDRGVPRST